MPASDSSFSAVGFGSEHYSVQRYLASKFPDIEIRRRYEEGMFLERPYMIVSMVSPSVSKHSAYAAFSVTAYVISYYAIDFADAQGAADKLSLLSWEDNRIQLYDYSDPQNPSAMTNYKLRVQQATNQLISDLDDDTMHNVVCNLTIEGKRSNDGTKAQGTVLESVEIGVG